MPSTNRVNRTWVFRFGLILVAAVTVLWIRMLPLSVAGAKDPSQYRYRGADGEERVYFLDADGFLWLRHARNYLRSGTTCDAVVGGECRDTYADAPVGRRMLYARSLHIAAIVGLHRLLNTFHPNYPLEASAYWVVVLVGLLGVLPAFAIGRRVGGEVGGVAAAVLIGVNPFFLTRSVGCDDDVWNLVLPLFTVWAALAAVSPGNTRRRATGAVLAAVFVGLDAATWSGWPFAWAVVMAALSGDLLRRGLTRALRAWRGRPRDGQGLGVALLVLIVFCAASGVIVWLARPEDSYAGVIADVLSRASGILFGAAPSNSPNKYWPSALVTVTELERLGLANIAGLASGNAAYFAAALVGLLSLWLPWSGQRQPAGAALLITIWFAAALLLARGGARFILVLVAPAGIAFAAALGWLHRGLAMAAARLAGRRVPALAPMLGAIALVPVIAVAVQATGFANLMVPPLSHAWWETLTHIREATPPEAIVDTSWDYGHATKYIAERRVSADGASLLTHAPYWFARALLTQNERETVGLLRMLNCGSDATPGPEGRFGAYGKLRAHGLDDLGALAAVVALSVLDRSPAREYLLAHGLTDAAAEDILASTHCTSGPAYLVLTNQLNLSTLWTMAAWDFQRAYAVNVSRHRTQGEAVDDLVRRFGLTADKALTLYRQAGSLATATAAQEFIVPPREYLLTEWQDCPNTADCGRALLQAQIAGAHPGQILLAEPDRLVQMTRRDAPDANVVGLVDDVRHRFLLGTHYLVYSTFIRLMYLDGRYSPYFEKFDERGEPPAERVVTWRIRDEPRRATP